MPDSLDEICPLCAGEVGHADNCPVGKLIELECQTGINCEECKQPASVARNEAGFLECRNCHTLFAVHRKLRRVFLCRPTSAEVKVSLLIPVDVLPTRGQGQFPIDEEIAKLRQRVEELRRQS